MSDKNMKIVLSVLTGILLMLIIGLFVFNGSTTRVDLNKIALRVGELRQYQTMNRADTTKFMNEAFSNLGYNVVESSEDNLYPTIAEDAGVNLYVRGNNPVEDVKPNNKAVNIVYIRDFTTLYPEEMKHYDGIATSSHDFYAYALENGYAAAYVPELTNPMVFYPSYREDLVQDIIYVGDNDKESPSVAAALEAKLPIKIYGRFWVGNIESENFGGEYIHESDLKSYFTSAKINLVNVTPHESEIAIVPSRVYDIAASKGFMIAPYNKEIEAIFGDAIPMFRNAEELKALYEQYIDNPEARAEKAEKAYKIAVSEFNADAFAQRINGLVNFLIEEKRL